MSTQVQNEQLHGKRIVNRQFTHIPSCVLIGGQYTGTFTYWTAQWHTESSTRYLASRKDAFWYMRNGLLSDS